MIRLNRLKLAGIVKAPNPNLVIGSDANGDTVWQEPSGGWGLRPLTPTNQRPIDGEVNIIENPLFESTDFAHPFGLLMYGYQLVIKKGEAVVYDSGNLELTITKFRIPKGKIVTGTTYSWSVRYQDHQLNWSDWSAPTSFTTQAVFGAGSVDTPFLLIPTNGSALNSPYPMLLGSTWGSTGNLIQGDSTFEISRDPNFATTIESVTLNGRVFQSAQPYPRGEVFCARMKDRSTTGEESSWSSISCFAVRTLFREQRIGIVLVDPVNWIFQRVDGNFNPVNLDLDYWMSNAIWAGLESSRNGGANTLIDGQEMVVLPAYNINSGIVPTGIYTGKRFWMIDPTQPTLEDKANGWHTHEAFLNPSGGFQDALQISAYRIGNVGGVAVSSRSVAAYTTNVDAVQIHAKTRNTDPNNPLKRGWHTTTFRQIEAIKLMALIEYGSLTAIKDAFTQPGLPYRGFLLWDAIQLLTDGLMYDSAVLTDGVTVLPIPGPNLHYATNAPVEHIYGKADGASPVFKFDDWLIPRVTSKVGGAPNGSKSTMTGSSTYYSLHKDRGPIGLNLVGANSNALMSKWD